MTKNEENYNRALRNSVGQKRISEKRRRQKVNIIKGVAITAAIAASFVVGAVIGKAKGEEREAFANNPSYTAGMTITDDSFHGKDEGKPFVWFEHKQISTDITREVAQGKDFDILMFGVWSKMTEKCALDDVIDDANKVVHGVKEQATAQGIDIPSLEGADNFESYLESFGFVHDNGTINYDKYRETMEKYIKEAKIDIDNEYAINTDNESTVRGH